MTHAFLILWMATAQTAPAPTAEPASANAQNVPSDNERTLKAQLDEARAQLDEARAQRDEARDQLAKTKEESGLPDNAVAALLVSGRPELASLIRVDSRDVFNRGRRAEIEVYVSMRKNEPMVAVVVNLKNPRDQKAWEPTEAWVSAPFVRTPFPGTRLPPPRLAPLPVAVRSAPLRILPGQSARIAVVFDKTDLAVADGPFEIALQRDGETEFEFELRPSDVQPTPETGG